MSRKKLPIDSLRATMKALRDPDTGCPWDIEQDFDSIAPHTIEEAYEVADAIEQKDMEALKDELGDLLLQVVYHAQIAEERGLFNFDDVAEAVNTKMVHRHPHVFGDVSAAAASDVDEIWDTQKDKEKSKGTGDSALDDVAISLPALLRAQKLQKKAARQGFEWTDISDFLDKLDEEVSEFRDAIEYQQSEEDIEIELGDILFVLANIGRHFGINAETALRKTNNKFYNRFSGMESDLKQKNKIISEQSIEDLLALWTAQKRKTG